MEDWISLYGLKQAVVILHDFRKHSNNLSSFKSEESVSLLVSEDNVKIEVKSEEPEDFLAENDYCQTTWNNCVPEEKNPDASDSITSKINDSKCVVNSILHVRSCEKKNSKEWRPTCEKCKRSFSNKYKLERHLYTHIPKELYTITCQKCLKRFASKHHLLLHLKLTHSGKTFKCNNCNNIFKHQTSLTKHYKKVHCTESTNEVQSFICDICNKSFKYKNSLESHIMYGHLKENKHYACSVCKKKFIKHSLMIRHKTRHTKIKPLPCTNCKRTFSRKYLLKQHTEKCLGKKDTNIIEECSKVSQEFLNEIILD